MISTIGYSGKGKTMKIVKSSVVARGWEEGGKKKVGGAPGIFRSMKTILYAIV